MSVAADIGACWGMRILIQILLLATSVQAQSVQAQTVQAQTVQAHTVWRAATEYPATAMPGEGLTTFAVRLSAATGGQVTLEPRFDGPDGLRSATIPAAVAAGRLQVGDAFAGSLTAMAPVFQLSSLPFLATGDAAALRLYRAARPAYEHAFAQYGQRILYVTPWPATGLWSQSAVQEPGDLQGLAVRTYDAAGTAVMDRAGARATELSFADAMPRLRDGSVRAVLSSGDGGAGRKLWEVTRHFTAIGYAMPLSFATVSQASYDALPAELRHGVDQAAAETEAAQWQALVQRTERNYAVMRANGVSLHEPSPALMDALREAAAVTIRDWAAAAGPEAAALLAGVGP